MAQPPAWEYEPGTEVCRLSAEGRLALQGQVWKIARAWAGEWVQIVRVEQRVLVYYCRSLVRELDRINQRSTMLDRRLSYPNV